MDEPCCAPVLSAPLDAADAEDLAQVFAALGDPVRLRILSLVADAGDPGHLAVAGLDHPACEGVLALTEDDEANLAVAQTVALLRPELPVITRAVSTTTAERMRAFGSPTVVNPFDRFGDHLRIALRAPASYQLMTWLESGPGAPLPELTVVADRGLPGFVAVETADAPVLASLIAGGRMAPTRGRVTLDGSDDASAIRASFASHSRIY